MDGSPQPPITYNLELLAASADKWKRSAGLRAVYGSIFEAIRGHMVEGPSLELGSGIGNLKESLPQVVTSDLVKTEYVDTACSAYEIIKPPDDASGEKWANLVAVDVLHHLCRPFDFFQSASTALADEGRIILVEPAATLFGRLFYTLFHEEPIRPFRITPPFEMEPDDESGEFANMGMGVSLFRLNKEACRERLSQLGLAVHEVAYRDLWAYPLSGGYSGPQLAPGWLIQPLLSLEGFIPQVLLQHLALRMVIVIRKLPRPDPS
ncbi:MAG: hypothetical protein AB3N64_00845 [Puniceicoccaceae bacterium]